MDEQEDVVVPNEEQTAEEVSAIKKAFAAKGFDVSDLDEEELLNKTLERIEKVKEIEQKARETQEAYDRLRLDFESKTRQPELEKEKPAVEAQKAIKKWQKVEVDPDWLVLTERDQNGQYAPKSKYGLAAIDAAEKLNQAERERRRRAELLTSDPVSALEEAGYADLINSRLEEKFNSFKSELTKAQEEKEKKLREEYEARQREQEGNQFYSKTKSEIFVLGENGEPLKDPITGHGRMTPFGVQVQKRADSLLARGLDNDMAIKLAYELESERNKEAPSKPEDKKADFLNKGRTSTPSRVATPSVPETPSNGRKRFWDMVVEDPANAEVLGDKFRGR